MTYKQINIGAGSVVHSFDSLSTDMPSTGVSVSPRGLVSVLIDGTTAGTVQVFVTFDNYDPASGDNSATALWTLLQTVTIASGTGQKIDFLIGPTGIKLATGTAGIAARIIT